MRKFIVSILLAGSGLLVHGQTSTKNYIKESTASVAATGTLSGLTEDQAKVRVTYFDGLGRLEQTVDQKASPDKNDIITVISYDNYGRNDKNFLPYESPIPGSLTLGAFHNSWNSEIETFYRDLTNQVVVEYDFYYSQTAYESSPLNRVIKSMAPGSAWVGSDRGVASEYEANSVADNIFEFDVEHTSGKIQVLSDFHYPAGSLYKNTTTDEDGHVIEVYTDKLSQVVAKKAFLSQSESADTYYLYDDFGQLRYVVQPEGIKALKALNTLALVESMANEMSFRDDWMFEYQYDSRNRMIVKKVPGAEPVYMVYDNRDRLVLTQDGNGRGTDVRDLGNTTYSTDYYEWVNYDIGSGGSVTLKPGFNFIANSSRTFYAGQNAISTSGKWTFTKYDILNRPVLSGEILLSGNRESIQDLIESNSSYDFEIAYVGAAGGNIYGYDNTSYPVVTTSDILTVTYYDNYSFLSDLGWGSEYTSSGYNTSVRGQITGGQVRQLSSGMLKSVIYYDSRMRPVTSIAQNHLSGLDKVATQYKNIVSPLVEKTTHIHSSSSGSQTIVEENTYDHMDRLLTTTHKIGSQSAVIIQSNSYNEIGQLTEKNLGKVGTGSYAQSVDYRYNIRGWLTRINGGTTFDDTGDKFGMELRYNNAPAGYNQYNGNIGQVLWKSLDDDSYTYDGVQNYQFTYDGLNRLKKATYTGQGADYFTVGGDDSGAIRYDLNGNIQSLSRYNYVKITDAQTAITFSKRLTDNLSYSYITGNQLSAVTDLSTDSELVDKRSGQPSTQVRDLGFKDGSNASNEYLYDANGNMISDANKGITNISYNHLNLPESVSTPNGTIVYQYDAIGTKLSMTETTGKVHDYIGGIHYEKEPVGTKSISYIQHAEGRAVNSGTTFAYEYNLTDHLGNVRVTVDAAGAVVQRDDYYPFGLTFNSMKGSPKNLYTYNGKEEQEETDWIDYGARMYDPALGRWNTVDPLSMVYSFASPYAYVLNMPVQAIDPDGMSIGSYKNDYHFDTVTGEVVEVETNSPDRIFVDGVLVAQGSYDGEYAGLFDVDKYYSNYSQFFNAKFGDRLLNDEFFIKQLNALGGEELKKQLIAARVRQAIDVYGVEVVTYILEVYGGVVTLGELGTILKGIGSVKTIIKKAIKDRNYKKQLNKIYKEIDQLIDEKHSVQRAREWLKRNGLDDTAEEVKEIFLDKDIQRVMKKYFDL